MTDPTSYAEPQNPALPSSGFVLDLEHAALVITDPQIDFLSPDGVSWPVFGDSIRDNKTVAHIGELFHAAKLGESLSRCRRTTSTQPTASGCSVIRWRNS